jgi:hypothetical protein
MLGQIGEDDKDGIPFARAWMWSDQDSSGRCQNHCHRTSNKLFMMPSQYSRDAASLQAK